MPGGGGGTQGGINTFFGDVDFCNGGWNGWDLFSGIDTVDGYEDRMPAMSEAAGSWIPGTNYREMPDPGHLPVAENPPLFARYFTRALDQLEA